MATATEYVSGELFFRSAQQRTTFLKNVTDKHEKEKELSNLLSFLQFDANTALQLSQSKKFLDSLKNIRRLNKAAYDAAVTHDVDHLVAFLEAACQVARDDARYTLGKTHEELIHHQQTADAQIMHLVLQYFAILRDELNSTRERLDKDAVEFHIMKQQAKRLRDVQIFSRHLRMETQGKVCLEVIDVDSPQVRNGMRENGGGTQPPRCNT